MDGVTHQRQGAQEEEKEECGGGEIMRDDLGYTEFEISMENSFKDIEYDGGL